MFSTLKVRVFQVCKVGSLAMRCQAFRTERRFILTRGKILLFSAPGTFHSVTHTRSLVCRGDEVVYLVWLSVAFSGL